jgi:predicted NBD/HSP70 family sugar kinase
MKSQEGRAIGAVDIGGTKIAVGLVDEAGKMLASDECPTDPNLASPVCREGGTSVVQS